MKKNIILTGHFIRHTRSFTFLNSRFRFEVDSDSLTIRNVVEGDAGTYTCIMKTSLDQDSASAVLTVVGMFTLNQKNML